MKLIHLSDLHLGKRVNEFSMLEDQAYILKSILGIIKEETPDGVMIAGDVYDKSVPSAEAVELFDDFLVRLAAMNLKVFIISGNHDSPERIAFGARIMDKSGIHLSPVYQGSVTPVTLEDEHGEVDIFMLPFIKPAHAKRFFPEETIADYTDALRVAVNALMTPEDAQTRRVLMTHQFVTGAKRSESEELSVGGADNVDASVFADFDYVALGHLHGPQSVGQPTVRYCGSPLKYSFSEADHKKSVTVVELAAKGSVTVRTVPLTPRHDMRELKGTYMDLTAKKTYENTPRDDYLRITLTDEEDIPNAIGNLRVIYRNLMKLEYDNTRTRTQQAIDGTAEAETKTPPELFAEFYEKQNNRPMSEEQRAMVHTMMESIWGDLL